MGVTAPGNTRMDADDDVMVGGAMVTAPVRTLMAAVNASAPNCDEASAPITVGAVGRSVPHPDTPSTVSEQHMHARLRATLGERSE